MKTHAEAAIDLAIVKVLAAKAEQLTARVVLERAKERAMMEDIKAHGGVLPGDYWLPRHRAEGQLRATLAAIDDLS